MAILSFTNAKNKRVQSLISIEKTKSEEEEFQDTSKRSYSLPFSSGYGRGSSFEHCQ